MAAAPTKLEDFLLRLEQCRLNIKQEKAKEERMKAHLVKLLDAKGQSRAEIGEFRVTLSRFQTRRVAKKDLPKEIWDQYAQPVSNQRLYITRPGQPKPSHDEDDLKDEY